MGLKDIKQNVRGLISQVSNYRKANQYNSDANLMSHYNRAGFKTRDFPVGSENYMRKELAKDAFDRTRSRMKK